MIKISFTFLLGVFLFNSSVFAQAANAVLGAPTHQDTLKGSVTPGRAWWKVVHYDLTIKPDYAVQAITGSNRIVYEVINNKHAPLMQIDLQAPLHIDSVLQSGKKLSFKQDGDAWFIKVRPSGKIKIQSVVVYYSGKPKVSINPPWDGGVVWTTDSLGRPWMAVACQHSGGSTWYPCKNYIGDKPDKGVSINIIVPDTLVAVANGRLKKIEHYAGKTSCYKWDLVSPISNYGPTFYIGKYVVVNNDYMGEKGKLDMDFWVLDYNKSKLTSYLIPEVHQTFKTFEHWFGQYPFYNDGFKMVEAPYIGMEHQSAVGYGNHFEHGRYKAKRLTKWDMKTDRMVTHENAHEWFGNSITAKDPADSWLQEGFAGYAEELAIEDRYGKTAGEEFFVDRTSGRISNKTLVISRYGIFEDGGEDGYLKGWVMLHMLRAMMNNDQKFRELLRGLSSNFYHQSVTTHQFENYISIHSQINMHRFFDQYLRSIQIPVLEYQLKDGALHYRFADCLPGFSVPLQTNWVKRIQPTTNWQVKGIHSIIKSDTLEVKPDFYVKVKRVQ